MKQCIKCDLIKEDISFQKGINRCNDCMQLYRKNHYSNNKVKINIQQKEYYENNKIKVLEYQKSYYYSDDGKLNSIFNTARRRAKKKNISFNLTKEWILLKLEEQKYCCAILKIPFNINQTDNYINPYMPSLDRINSSCGYTLDNVRIICTALNLAMNEFGEDVFYNICKIYLKNKNE